MVSCFFLFCFFDWVFFFVFCFLLFGLGFCFCFCLGNLWWGGQRKLVEYVLLGEKRMEEDLDFITIDRVLTCYSFNFTQVIIPYSLL